MYSPGMEQLEKIDIKAINSWRMEAVLTERMSCENGKVFLAGDCAHAFPPSGGFGLNTGIGDALNLAHKLSRACQGQTEALDSYDKERRFASKLTRDFAIDNHAKGVKIATKLNLHKPLLDFTDNAL